MITVADVERFYEQIRRSRTPSAFSEALQEITERMGFRFFALIHHIDLRENGARGVEFFNYPDAWAEQYRRRKLFSSDPIHRASHRTSLGFPWADVGRMVHLTADDKAVLQAARSAGLGDGFTIPANVPGETNGSCSFAMAPGESLVRRQLPLVNLVGACAFEGARHLSKAQPLPMEQTKITSRQAECIVLAAQGKTDWEIGRILGVSQDTVIQHLKDARDRYGVSKRTTLAIRALFDGSISFADVLSRSTPQFWG